MFARIASFEGGDNERLQQMAEEQMAAGGMTLPPGCTGGMTLVGASGRLFITWFDSQEAIDAAAEHFERMGDQLPEEVRGRRVSVESYEVVWNSWEQ